jgi:hypothetical protein
MILTALLLTAQTTGTESQAPAPPAAHEAVTPAVNLDLLARR